MRLSLNRPRRSVNVPTETLSTESRLRTDWRGIGSSPGSRSTSLARPRMVVVQGAIRARRSLGIAMVRDRTKTGRRLTSGSSHHHTSPLAGKSFTKKLPSRGRKPDHPIRPAPPAAVRRRWRIRHRSQPRDVSPQVPRELHRAGPHRSSPTSDSLRSSRAIRQPSCLPVCVACHNYATDDLELSRVRSAHIVPISTAWHQGSPWLSGDPIRSRSIHRGS